MLKWSVLFIGALLLWNSFLVKCNVEEETAEEQNGEEKIDVVTFLRNAARDLIDRNYDSLTGKALSLGLSPSCGVGMLKLVHGLRNLEPWVARLIDASGKYPNGLFQGSLSDLGAFDECIETVVRDDEGHEKIRAQYCNVHIKLTANDTSLFDHLDSALALSHRRTATFARYQLDPRVQGLSFGLCIPTFCDKEDVRKLLGSLLMDTPVYVPSCVTNEYPPIDNTQACIISFLAILAFIILLSSVIDIYHQNKAIPKAKKGLLIKILTVFSAPASTRLLLEVNKDTTSDAYRYRFLHGIRFFSMFMIIFGHSYSVFNFANVSRLVNALHYGDNLSFCFIFTGYLSVDTFLFLGGFLLTYNVLRERASRLVVIVVAIVRRYVRGTVPAFFVIMFCYLLPLIIDGPNAQLLFKNFYKEISTQWWSIVLQIRNLTGGLETGAFGHLWYLSTDFQLFVVSAIVVQILRRKPWTTIGTLVTLVIASNSFCTWQMNNEVYTPFVMPMAETFRSLVETLNDMYTLPTTHAPAFFAGCICTLLIRKYKEVKMSKVAVMVCWLVSIGIAFTSVFTMHFWLRGDNPPVWANKLFAFWNRTLWATWMCWMSFACATGKADILTRFLSWSPFIPLSRLCFGVYLVHLPFYFVKYFTAREKLFFSHFTMVSQAFAVTVWSYLLSYLVFIACEVPVGRIEKLILTRVRSKRGEDSNGSEHCLENGYKPSLKPTQDCEEDEDDSNGSDNNGQSSYL